MSHPYDKAADCHCPRCERERARRDMQRAHAVADDPRGQPVTRRQKVPVPRHATRAEQHARYIDCGPQAWDDREEGEG